MKAEDYKCKEHDLRCYSSNSLVYKLKCTKCNYKTIRFRNQFPDVQ